MINPAASESMCIASAISAIEPANQPPISSAKKTVPVMPSAIKSARSGVLE